MPCIRKNVFFTKKKVQTCSEDVIDFGFSPEVSGIYEMRLNFLGNDVVIRNMLYANEDTFKFPTKGLNENNEWLAEIYDSEGNKVIYTDEQGNKFDAFKFSTVIKINL